MQPLKLQREIHCLRCGKYEHFNNFTQIDYKTLIIDHEKKNKAGQNIFNKLHQFSENPIRLITSDESDKEIYKILNKTNLYYIKSDNDKIPIILRKIYPKLTNKEYFNLKNLMEFQQKIIKICHYCYLELTETKDESLKKTLYNKIKNGIEILEKHQNNELNIKKLEKLKKPFYNLNKIVKEDLKTECSKNHKRFSSIHIDQTTPTYQSNTTLFSSRNETEKNEKKLEFIINSSKSKKFIYSNDSSIFTHDQNEFKNNKKIKKFKSIYLNKNIDKIINENISKDFISKILQNKNRKQIIHRRFISDIGLEQSKKSILNINN